MCAGSIRSFWQSHWVTSKLFAFVNGTEPTGDFFMQATVLHKCLDPSA